jgi:glycosyltransferase involved in cell wall biosynthesis
MNICLLTPTFLPKIGGVELVVSSLARWYAEAGHQVIVVTQWPRKGKGIPEDHRLEYPVVRYQRPLLFHWPIGLLGITKAISKAHKQIQFDVIHCHMAYPTGPVAVSYGKKHNIPVVITTHGSDIRIDSRYRQRSLVWQSLCQSLRQADAITAISQDMMVLLKEIVGDSSAAIYHIPNAVDQNDLADPVEYDPAWPMNNDRPFILYLGGLTHKKGTSILLQAIKKLRETKKPIRLVIAGDGADRESLTRFVQNHQLTDCVEFVGRVMGKLKAFLLQNCRYVVMPSLTEGFGLVALEAFTCGKALVASDVGGLGEMLGEHKELGLLVPPGDVDALAKGLMMMESHLEDYQPKYIRSFAERYNQTAITQTYLDLYSSLVTATKSGR